MGVSLPEPFLVNVCYVDTMVLHHSMSCTVGGSLVAAGARGKVATLQELTWSLRLGAEPVLQELSWGNAWGNAWPFDCSSADLTACTLHASYLNTL